MKTRHWLRRITAKVLLTAVCGAPLCPAGEETDSRPPPSISIALLDSMRSFPGNLSALPASPPIPRNNPQSAAKIELGKMLFFDTRLSGDGSLSCATCHDPEKAYSDGRTHALGGRQQTAGAALSHGAQRRLQPSAILGWPHPLPGRAGQGTDSLGIGDGNAQ